MIKQSVNSVLGALGYKLSKLDTSKLSLNLYEQYEAESLNAKKFFNIGAGAFCHDYWTNIDYQTEHYSELQKDTSFINHDLMSLAALPVEEGEAELVYTSHTIEHISEEAAFNMFSEAYRILKWGGGFRVTAPNAMLDYKALTSNDRLFFDWYLKSADNNRWVDMFNYNPMDASIAQLFLAHVASQRSNLYQGSQLENHISDTELNNIFNNYDLNEAFDIVTSKCFFDLTYPGFHMSWWSPSKVIGVLKRVGFSSVYLSGYGQSAFPPMRDVSKFDNTMPYVSFYIEAIK